MIPPVRVIQALLGLLITNAAMAADIPIPTEAEVIAAVKAEIDGQQICTDHIYPIYDGNGLRNIDLPAELPRIAKMVDALVANGLVIRKEAPEPASGTKFMHLEYTQAGRDAFGGQGKKCLGVRKLASLIAHTPPASAGDYTVVHVSYRWTPEQVPAWADKLAESGTFHDLNILAKQQQDTAILIYTNHGWVGQSVFGYPIK